MSKCNVAIKEELLSLVSTYLDNNICYCSNICSINPFSVQCYRCRAWGRPTKCCNLVWTMLRWPDTEAQKPGWFVMMMPTRAFPGMVAVLLVALLLCAASQAYEEVLPQGHVVGFGEMEVCFGMQVGCCMFCIPVAWTDGARPCLAGGVARRDCSAVLVTTRLPIQGLPFGCRVRLPHQEGALLPGSSYYGERRTSTETCYS